MIIKKTFYAVVLSSISMAMIGCSLDSDNKSISKEPTKEQIQFKKDHNGITQSDWNTNLVGTLCFSESSSVPNENKMLKRLMREAAANDRGEFASSMNGRDYMEFYADQFKGTSDEVKTLCGKVGSMLGKLAIVYLKYPSNYQYNDTYSYAISNLNDTQNILYSYYKKFKEYDGKID